MAVEARLLAGQVVAEVARRAGLARDTVAAYAALFFDVDDRLSAADWIYTHVLGAGALDPAAARDPALVLKEFVYLGGPLVVEAVLPYLVGVKDPFEPAPDLSTPEGRRDQEVRLLVAERLLPRDPQTGTRILRILSETANRRRTRPINATWSQLWSNSWPSGAPNGVSEYPSGGVERFRIAFPRWSWLRRAGLRNLGKRRLASRNPEKGSKRRDGRRRRTR
jgi:hypothetical protein